ncbi:YoaK family protein [Rarobacter faecitabidus]|uniref:Uncharacterized membrane protein YoaK (UPF0700 family) n=1 Tax=Rarobacter faecitabidus TaxID=13243 RepID=A0A542ZWE6_RARFA|nr:YoaK family protein [Rarobacter faecitabidus]TQL64681.1 uncharacterized membrane protein YoaK (UPF0700 family) [Rarobacter faecitabidus]
MTAGTALHRLGHSRLNVLAALLLTFTTGMIDAIGYLGLDRVFTANMTGNVVILAIGVAGGAALPVAGPLVAFAGFFLGAALSGRAHRGAGSGWTSTTTRTLLATGLLVSATALAVLLSPPQHGSRWALVVTATLGLAMGAQAAAARSLGVADVSTVVVTMTLTGLAADSSIGAGQNRRWRRRTGALLALAAGAAAGALLVKIGLAAGLAACGVSIIAVGVATHRSHRAIRVRLGP